jgi:hypothetical protein
MFPVLQAPGRGGCVLLLYLRCRDAVKVAISPLQEISARWIFAEVSIEAVDDSVRLKTSKLKTSKSK